MIEKFNIELPNEEVALILLRAHLDGISYSINTNRGMVLVTHGERSGKLAVKSERLYSVNFSHIVACFPKRVIRRLKKEIASKMLFPDHNGELATFIYWNSPLNADLFVGKNNIVFNMFYYYTELRGAYNRIIKGIMK